VIRTFREAKREDSCASSWWAKRSLRIAELAMHPASHQEKSIAARRSYNCLNIAIRIP